MLLVHVAAAARITGRVVGIADGDTLTLLGQGRHQTKVRMAEVDAPESHQPNGSRAKHALSGLVFGKEGQVVMDTDRYGRHSEWRRVV
jgi:endonuclease YncB( thermonuclease family)